MSCTLLGTRRANALGKMTQLCLVERLVAGVPDGYGGRTSRYETVATDVACRLYPTNRPVQEEEGSQKVTVANWEISLAHDANVLRKDVLTVGGALYEVLGTDAGVADAVMLRAFCTRKN
jgi:hypothetical protein